MRMVFIISPYGGSEQNVVLAKRYMRMAAAHGLVPIAPHVMFDGVLNDHVAAERAAGMEAGRMIMGLCQEVWICGAAVTSGMLLDMQATNLPRTRVVPAALENWELHNIGRRSE